MPFLSELPIYRAMAQAGPISTFIESLGVQADWRGVQIQGVAPPDANKFVPLVRALAQVDSLEIALNMFTVRMFCYGNVVIYVGPVGVVEWRADWRQFAQHVAAAQQGHVLHARRTPIDAQGYGESALAPGVAAFQALTTAYDARILELSRNPLGASTGFAAEHMNRINNVLRAIGFDAWNPDGDWPRFPGVAQFRAQMKTIFETEMLQPYAAAKRIAGHPVLAP